MASKQAKKYQSKLKQDVEDLTATTSKANPNPNPHQNPNPNQIIAETPKLQVPAEVVVRRRHRSLNLPKPLNLSDDESDSRNEITRSGSLKTKKFSLPLPTPSYSESESTSSSYTSRSSGVESLSGGEITPSDLTETGLSGSSTPPTKRSDDRKTKRWSRPALTHTFTRIYSYVFERCRTCDAYIYLGGYKCEKCNLYSHSKCLKSVVILCGQKPLPRRKAQVFGIPLIQMKEDVPFIVAKCCIEIEARGYKIRGIYRVNGVVSRVQRLIRSLENGPYLIDFSEANPNDLSHVLKEFFRSLPQPIITSDLYMQFMNVAKKYRYSSTERLTPTTSQEDNITELREIVNKLPAQHKSTLSYLMHHLRFIAENQQFNEMSAKNLGIVFAPTIFRMKDVDGNCFGMLFDNALQTLIIELLIKNSYEIFGPQPRVQLFNYG